MSNLLKEQNGGKQKRIQNTHCALCNEEGSLTVFLDVIAQSHWWGGAQRHYVKYPPLIFKTLDGQHRGQTLDCLVSVVRETLSQHTRAHSSKLSCGSIPLHYFMLGHVCGAYESHDTHVEVTGQFPLPTYSYHEGSKNWVEIARLGTGADLLATLWAITR